MNDPLTQCSVAALVALELGLLAAAGFATARHRGLPVAEAAAYGAMGGLMAASALLQVSLVLDNPTAGFLLEGVAVALAAGIVVAFRSRLFQLKRIVRSLASRNRVLFAALALIGTYLGAQALLLPPMAMDRAALGRLTEILATFHGSGILGSLFPEALPPLNSAVLPWMILRFGTVCGTGLFGFAAYLVLGAATYALARRYAWPPTALTVAMVVWSMPRFVLHATSCGFEIVPAAASLVAVLALYRTVEEPNAGDLAVMLCAICFSMTDGPYGLAFPAVLAALAVVLLFRRHGWSYWETALRRNRGGGLAALPLIFLFSQTWVFAINLAAAEPWTGVLRPPAPAPNAGGILEAAANALRYLIQLAHLPPPLDGLWQTLTGTDPKAGLMGLYNNLIGPVLEQGHALAPFALDWGFDPRASWFGPLALLLAVPALVYALIRAPRRLKALAVALIGYAYLVVLIMAWHRYNVRYFSPFFACSGFVVAFFLPPWRLTRTGKRVLRGISLGLMIFVVLGHGERPPAGWKSLTAGTRSVSQRRKAGAGVRETVDLKETIWRQASALPPAEGPSGDKGRPPGRWTRQGDPPSLETAQPVASALERIWIEGGPILRIEGFYPTRNSAGCCRRPAPLPALPLWKGRLARAACS